MEMLLGEERKGTNTGVNYECVSLSFFLSSLAFKQATLPASEVGGKPRLLEYEVKAVAIGTLDPNTFHLMMGNYYSTLTQLYSSLQ